MKQAPMSLTPALFMVLIVSAIAGALVATLVQGFGITGWLGFFCASFIPVPIGGIVRSATVAALGSVQGIDEPVPVAGPLAVRLGIGVVIAGIVALALNLAGPSFEFGAISGSVAALITSMLLTVIFATMMSRRS